MGKIGDQINEIRPCLETMLPLIIVPTQFVQGQQCVLMPDSESKTQ